jgi:DNA polymerase eta
MISEFETFADLTKCILHMDLDCYYCQVEQNRLGIPPSQPLAVRQWDDLIAVNYAARAFGIKRMDSFTEAKQKCPDLRVVHVATYREGEMRPRYHDEEEGGEEGHPPSRAIHKASLESYRKESLRIFEILEEMCDVCEKGGLDEAFLDVTQRVNNILEQSAELDITEYVLCAGNIVGELSVSRENIPLHDLRLIVASHFAHDIRERLRTELNYTCSIGVAHNKTLAKLGSALRKPDQQTVILASGVAEFIRDVPFRKIRWLGGKLGAHVVEDYQVETAGDLWPYSQSILCQKYGQETGIWLWNICRGIDDAPVVARSKSKSLMAFKSFAPVNTMEKIEKFLGILASELSQRLREDYQRNKRHPKKLCLHCYCASTSHSRYTSFPTHGVHHPVLIVKTALQLLTNLPNLFPCSSIGLGVNSFIDQNETILKTSLITQFFSKGDPFISSPQDDDDNDDDNNDNSNTISLVRAKNKLHSPEEYSPIKRNTLDRFFRPERPSAATSSNDYVLCDKCHSRLLNNESTFSLHADYHFALELSKQLNAQDDDGSAATSMP